MRARRTRYEIADPAAASALADLLEALLPTTFREGTRLLDGRLVNSQGGIGRRRTSLPSCPRDDII
jgi:hypothetical protein